MKSYYTSFFLLVFSNILLSQSTYDLFSTQGLSYGIVYDDPYDGKIHSFSRFYDGDTLIDDKKYLQFALFEYPVAKDLIYIDGRKVYLRSNYADPQGLIYDFGLEVKDTFSRFDFKKFVVTKKETIQFEDKIDRIYIQLKSSSSSFLVEWIEGIGDINNGLLYMTYIHSGDQRLTCVRDKSGILYEKKYKTVDCDSLFCKSTVCRFSYTNDGQNLNFLNTSVYYKDVLWDFGDGNTSNEIHPTHKYEDFGCKAVTLTTTSTCGANYVSKKKINYCYKGDWQVVQKLPVEVLIRKINFGSDNNYWMQAYKDLYTTNDCGLTFKKIQIPTDENSILVKIDNSYYDGKIGVLLTTHKIGYNYFSRIYITKDKGISWKLSKQFDNQFLNLYTHSSGTFVGYQFFPGDRKLFISSDFGQSWRDADTKNFKNGATFDITDKWSLALGYKIKTDSISHSFIDRSFDSGHTWETHSVMPFKDIKFIDDVVYLISENDELFKSVDSLKSFTKLSLMGNFGYSSQLIFKDKDHGYIFYDENNIMFTSDGGQTWTKQNCENKPLYKVFLDYNNNFFATNREYEILKFFPIEVDPDCKMVDQNPTEDSFAPIIYPNPLPFGSCLTIKDDTNTLSGLEIFNIHGQQVVPFQNAQPDMMINTSSLTPGTYILRIFYDDMSTFVNKTLFVIDLNR